MRPPSEPPKPLVAPGPIGVFDSGFGGLTIFKRIRAELPAYDYIYLGDNARSPYGNRSFEVVLAFTLEGVKALFDRGCPLVIIACNTASAKALRTIQQGYLAATCPDRRVLGVIRPTVEVLEHQSRTKSIALWATQGTVLSDSFAIEIDKHAPGIRLAQQACPLLVPLVEAGELEGDGLRYFVRKYWEATRQRAADLDTLLLACTHYPLIRSTIREVVPPEVSILAQDDLVARSLANYLERHPEMEQRLGRTGSCQYLTTDQCDHFDRLAHVFMGHAIESRMVQVG